MRRITPADVYGRTDRNGHVHLFDADGVRVTMLAGVHGIFPIGSDTASAAISSRIWTPRLAAVQRLFMMSSSAGVALPPSWPRSRGRRSPAHSGM
jgi:hypothetical protein